MLLLKEDQTQFRTQLIKLKHQIQDSNHYYTDLIEELFQLIDSIDSLEQYIYQVDILHDHGRKQDEYFAIDPIIKKLSEYHGEAYLNRVETPSLLKLYYLAELISKKIDYSLTKDETANPSLYIEVEKYHALLAEIKCEHDEFHDKFTEVPLTSDEEEDIADTPSAQRITNNETSTPDTLKSKLIDIKVLYNDLNKFKKHTMKVREHLSPQITSYVKTIKQKTRKALKLQFLSSSGHSNRKLEQIKAQIQEQTEIISKKIPHRCSQMLQNIATLAMSICTVGIVAIVATCYNLKRYNHFGMFRPPRSYAQTLADRTNQYARECVGRDNRLSLKA